MCACHDVCVCLKVKFHVISSLRYGEGEGDGEGEGRGEGRGEGEGEGEGESSFHLRKLTNLIIGIA